MKSVQYSEIDQMKSQLQEHELYHNINNISDLQCFMETHVFAVWDFMSLLKRLQIDLTTTYLPWRPSPYSKKAVRLINEIVLGEESDSCPIEIHPDGTCDHFTMYLMAMKELGCNTSLIEELVDKSREPDEIIKVINKLPEKLKRFVMFHIDLSLNGKIEDVAASFLFGRERLLPALFEAVLEQINLKSLNCPSLKYYLERHIEIDGDEHSHMALELFEELCPSNEQKQDALQTAKNSLNLRSLLWDQVVDSIAIKNSIQNSVQSNK